MIFEVMTETGIVFDEVYLELGEHGWLLDLFMYPSNVILFKK